MNLLVSGATGFLGSALVSKLLNLGHKVTVLSRDLNKAEAVLGKGPVYLQDVTQLQNLDDYHAVINLAGEPIIDKPWTSAQQQKICHSRWHITEKLAELINKSNNPPECFISGSAIGFYGPSDEERLTETSPGGSDFGHQVCIGWETRANAAASDATRVCIVRTGLVLGSDGGLLARMLMPFKLGVGGRLGSGNQGMSWIHLDDYVDLLLFLLNEPQAQGVFNAVAPNPESNQSFSRTLAGVLKRPSIFGLPSWLLKLVFGKRATLLLDGQFVLPTAALNLGFAFRYPELKGALEQLLLPAPKSELDD
ncbi:TIGR01777 family oxidoreductase [Paraferrimonas sedimenticola]|uniref:Epimerase n=1 Tax=Paraferrimonas sedimenticola TaxID=375674 RepID=A0AA37RT27_9GAMM|nr:TIGR01777 family oxidoreductase [Paraferrimonas sedimenticola]GLP94821.1 epimerase [Paraferrimonas sedimenticola]